MTLETTDGTFYFFKADILKGTIMYSTDKNFIANAVTITARRAFEIINMNRRGEKPESLTESVKKNEPQKPVDLVAVSYTHLICRRFPYQDNRNSIQLWSSLLS